MDNEIEKMTAKERTMKQLEDGIKSVLDSKKFCALVREAVVFIFQ